MISKNFNNELFLYELVLVSDFNSISLYIINRTLQRHAYIPYMEELCSTIPYSVLINVRMV